MKTPGKATELRMVNLGIRKDTEFDIHGFDHEFLRKALEIGQDSSRSMRSIVDDLASYCYNEGKLLGDEFMEKFLEYDIAGMLVGNFMESLPDRDGDVNCDIDPELIEAREELRLFLQSYASDRTKTVHAFLKDAKVVFPNVNFYQLFQEEALRRILCDQINEAAKSLAAQKYKYLYEGEPEAECKEAHRENLIADFLFSRVLNIGTKGKLRVDRQALKSLIGFLDKQGYELDNLYLLIYREFRTMAEIRKNTRSDARRCLSGIIVSSDYLFMEEDFDFDDFFKRYFTPEIMESRAKKLPKKDLQLIDVSCTDPGGMAQAILPENSKKPVTEIVENIAGSEKKYLDLLRRYFNYVDTPGMELSDLQVMSLVAEHLKMAKRQIEYTIKEALKRRDQMDPVRQDCRFLGEIINCTDIRKLLAWLSNPKSFGAEFPEHEGVPYKIVAHQVKIMLEMMLFYRKHVFENSYRAARSNRKRLEQHFSAVDALNLREKESITITFRIKTEVDADQKPVIHTDEEGIRAPAYEVVYLDEEKLGGDEQNDILYVNPEKSIIVNDSGKTYKLFPVEKKKFQRVKASIPNGNGERHECVLLVYSGDGNLMHVKSEESFLSSILRGNEPTDVCRWMIVTEKDEDGEALRRFLNMHYSDYIKIKDNVAKRNLGGKNVKKRAAGSQVYQKVRGYTSSMYAMLPRKRGRKMDHVRVNFETQIFDDLDGMIARNISDFTDTSHSRSYVPRREYDNMFRYLFPPVIYGKKYADYVLQGYKGDGAV